MNIGRRAGASVVLLALTLAWLAVTSRAAPTFFAVRKVPDDESALRTIFGRFVRLQTARAILQAAGAVASVELLVSTLSSR